MRELLNQLFSSDFMPHGHCYLWKPGLVWLQVLSNLFIGVAYVSISATLLYLTRRMKSSLPFEWVYIAFGIFIVSCGITHFMDILTVWTPTYWLDGAIRAITAFASVVTAVLLFPLVPRVMQLSALFQAERSKSRADLEASERNARLIVDSIPTLAWTARVDGWLDFFNRRWFEYTGTTAEQMNGWGWKSVHDPASLPEVTERWETSIRTGQPFEMIFPLRRADGTFRAHLTRVHPIVDADGKVTRWFGTNTDIEDQLRIERELEQAVRVRDEFLAIASHELRTPLSTLRLQADGIVRALRKGAITVERLAPKLDTLDGQVDRLERLVTMLLDVSNIESGRLRLELSEVDVVELTREVVKSLQVELDRAGCSVSITAAGPIVVTWDRGRIDQVLTNLLTNAIKYGAGKPIEVTLVDGESVRIEARDHGIGIPSEHLERIFGRFERAVDAKHYSGLGLGLWVSRQIVQAHGGAMRVASQPGAGSTFVVELPKRVPA